MPQFIKDSQSAESRLAEIADLLALGFQRVMARQSSDKSADFWREFASLHDRPERSWNSDANGERMTIKSKTSAHMLRSLGREAVALNVQPPQKSVPTSPDHRTVLAQLAALKDAPAAALKTRWRDLFETEPPPYNRRFLESRLAYRIQELAYGGLKPETLARLRQLGKQFDANAGASIRKRVGSDRPIAGTRLIREYQGIEHCVTVRRDDFEYQGRLYKSLSAVARSITGTRWNGLVFFGLKNQRVAS